MIGSRLVRSVRERGGVAIPLSRRASGGGSVRWDPAAREIDHAGLADLDAVVNLAGESIDGRWTEAKKERIRSSRVEATRFLAEVVADLPKPPRIFVHASAVGYYGDRGHELLREESAPGSGFLAKVAQEWEAAAELARERGLRTVSLRIGMVLAATGGALPKLLRPIRFGVGGRIGSGCQIVSWIEIEDLVSAIHHVLERGSLEGAVNCVAPETVTNVELVRTLGRIVRRPTLIPLPELVGRLLFGEMAEEVLFASARVEPAKLQASGFRFRHASLEEALRHVLGRPSDQPPVQRTPAS